MLNVCILCLSVCTFVSNKRENQVNQHYVTTHNSHDNMGKVYGPLNFNIFSRKRSTFIIFENVTNLIEKSTEF